MRRIEKWKGKHTRMNQIVKNQKSQNAKIRIFREFWAKPYWPETQGGKIDPARCCFLFLASNGSRVCCASPLNAWVALTCTLKIFEYSFLLVVRLKKPKRELLRSPRREERRRCMYLIHHSFPLSHPTHIHYSVDPFTRKEWYDIKAPAIFTNRNVGKTVVNKTVGTSMCLESLLLYFV